MFFFNSVVDLALFDLSCNEHENLKIKNAFLMFFIELYEKA